METLPKRTYRSALLKKNVYFIGVDEYGDNLYLEAPSWDCGWYWGFGYIEHFENGRYVAHTHFDGLVWFKDEKNNYVAHLNESPKMKATVLSERESWELSDLMKQFYSLRQAAEIFHRGHANLTSSVKVDSKNPEMVKYINEVALPKIFKRVLEILTPGE